MSYWILVPASLVAVVVVPQLAAVLGGRKGVIAGLGGVALLVALWLTMGRMSPKSGPADWSAVASSSSESCQKCHADHYATWYQTYHRTMTREATPETVKGNFDNSIHDYQGMSTRLTREGDKFVMETVDMGWALDKALGRPEANDASPKYAKFTVDRLVGSHWLQECLHKVDDGIEKGRYMRLPVLYHIGEKRWVHSNGAFLIPDTPDFWQMCRNVNWNDTCLYCHNTGPVKNPVRVPGAPRNGFNTTVQELGISCEACHGPGGDHVSRNRNPARRYDLQLSGKGDPTIVNPNRLSVQRRDEICARCHGALVPKAEAWDLVRMRDPYIPGMDLARFNHFFTSEAEQAAFDAGRRKADDPPIPPTPKDGRFFGDGTPLTTALEYNGMALSACYQHGKGKMSCLSCHELHGKDPDHLLKPGMRTNEACLQCHESYRANPTAHTRHGADSAGSQCVNCHMPHTVYSLMNTHRSHRIENPTLAGSLDTGKPHACNLCHLDKSLGWTKDELAKWPTAAARKHRPLTEDERKYSHALLTMIQADARSRVMVAGAFGTAGAQQASGTDWYGPFLSRLLVDERYPAVRYLAHRGLESTLGGVAAGPFDYMAVPADRKKQLEAMRQKFDRLPVTRPMPFLPLTPGGLPDEAVLERLRLRRNDPDLTINE